MIVAVKPRKWDFAAISHRWESHDPWEAFEKRPYPAAGGVHVTAVKKKSLLALARLCLSLGIKYFWLDCLCIDQKSRLEQAREILNMGKYYSKAKQTLVFPYGLDTVGPPFLESGHAPVWHSRAWTLQEQAMAGDKVVFVLYFEQDGNSDGKYDHKALGLTTLAGSARGRVQPFEYFASGDDAKYCQPRRYLALVPNHQITNCRAVYASSPDVDFDDAARGEALKMISVMQSQRDWTLWSALREMFRREASHDEDLIYGLIGLLGISIPPDSIKYGIGLRGALLLLVSAVHVDQRLLLSVVESYHGSFIDGFSALPAFRDPTAVPAPRLTHIRTLGVADFSGHSGMFVTAPSMLVNLVRMIDESNPLNEAMELPMQERMDALEEEGAMDKCAFTQLFPYSSEMQLSDGVVRMAPGTPTLGLTLIAVTEVDAPTPDVFRRRGEPLTTFCCLVCSDGGSVKRKVGIALVVAFKHIWQIQRHLIA